jgi:hypothetical protein
MPTPARRSDQPPPFAEPVEEAVDDEMINWLDSAYFAAEAQRMEAEARRQSAGLPRRPPAE